MIRRTITALLSITLLGLGLTVAGPAVAGHVEVPSEDDANIVDTDGDANYHSPHTGAPGPVTFVAADIYLVWFTHDADNLYTHIQTRGTAQADSLLYRVWVDPTGGGDACMAIQAVSPGEANDAAAYVRLVRECGDGTEEVGEFIQEEGPPLPGRDTPSGIHTIVTPRSAHEAFADGNTLAIPEADTSHNIPGVVRGVPIIDDTETGKDYEITAPEPAKQSKRQGPKKPPPGQAVKNCNQIKNKKKRQACKRQQRQACKAYQPGELGAEAETLEVPSTATEEEPLEATIELEQSVANVTGGDPAMTHLNLQLDKPPPPEAGLYVLFEFPMRRDYDLILRYPDGSRGAESTAFNTLIEFPHDHGHGGEATDSSELLVGIKTSACQGWTLEPRNYFGEGGEFTLKIWLGETQNDPLPMGEKQD